MPFGIYKILDHYDIVYYITERATYNSLAVAAPYSCGRKRMTHSLTHLLTELITRQFVEHSLLTPGSAKYPRVFFLISNRRAGLSANSELHCFLHQGAPYWNPIWPIWHDWVHQPTRPLLPSLRLPCPHGQPLPAPVTYLLPQTSMTNLQLNLPYQPQPQTALSILFDSVLLHTYPPVQGRSKCEIPEAHQTNILL